MSVPAESGRKAWTHRPDDDSREADSRRDPAPAVGSESRSRCRRHIHRSRHPSLCPLATHPVLCRPARRSKDRRAARTRIQDWKSWVLRRVLSTGMDPTGTRKLLAYARISCGIRPQARFGAGAPAPLRFHRPVSGSAPKYRGPCNTGEHQGTMRNHAFPKSARATSSWPDCPHLTFGASNCADLDTSSRRLNMARGQG